MSIFLESNRLNKHQFKLSDVTIKMYGDDAQTYLHSQTTNDICGLTDGHFHFNSILDNSGKIISSFIVFKKSKTELYLILEEEYIKETLERIERFHISEDFEVAIESMLSVLIINDRKVNSNGHYFFDTDRIEIFSSINEFSSDEIFSKLRTVTGVPLLGCEVNVGELINNTRFDELCVDYSKGCYPGQETVSKINTRRGAAYKPVLCIIDKELSVNKGSKFRINSKKAGVIKNSFTQEGKTYLYIDLLREFRVDNSRYELDLGDCVEFGVIHYYPFLKPDSRSLAQDLYDCAVEFFYKNENEKALDYFSKSIAVDPTFEDAFESLGVLYGRLEQFDKAIELMEQLRAINPKCMMAFTNLSLYHMKIGNIDIAEKYKSEATFLNFELLGDEAQRKKAKEEIAAKKLADMGRREGMFKQVLEMDPQDAMANNGMGEIELERSNYTESKKYFFNAIESDEKYSVAYLGLAKSLYQLGENEQLIEILTQGIHIASKNGDLMPANEMQALLVRLS